ncbi:MAG: hypothetical protein HYY49_08220 [Ignavibacteriales bacterium]|nr:hypothetical protein [Ignavibacteriales bacterium]
MPISKSYHSIRSFQVAAAVLLAFSLACAQIPLFNYLGFEFSALTSIVASFLAGFVSLSLCRQHTSLGEKKAEILFSETTRASLLLLAIPFVVMSLNALVVKNCDYLDGATFFLLGPLPAVLFANAFACLIASIVERWNKTLYVFLFVCVLLHIPVVTFTGIQIFAFNPLVGFFPGFTYDETLNVTTRLLSYRVQTLIQVALLWSILHVVQKRKTTRLSLVESVSSKERWLAMGLMLVLASMMWFSDDLGLSSSTEYIRGQLGGRIETEHFVISYPTTIRQSRAREIALQHEFYYARLSNELRVNPKRKFHSYVYFSAEQKGRLVGAWRTNITKPWLWQIHINQGDIESSLKHELVHVMAADFGFPLFRIGLNSGLTEGLAVAVERTAYESVVHRTAAEVFAVGVRPNIENMFSWSGFLRAYPGVSYTIAGSFCRYLIDRYGLRRFKRVYRTGDFIAHYNRGLGELIDEWKEYLARFTITDAEMVKAAYLFRRPSIFGKECARVLANINAQTRSLYNRREYVDALESSSSSLQKSTNIEAVFQKTNTLVRMRHFQEAIDFAEEKLTDSTIAHALFPLRLALGDAYWAVGLKERAVDSYQRILASHVNLTLDEACALRIEAAFSGGQHLQPYFIEENSDSGRVQYLQSVLRRNNADLLAKYLLGRELASREEYSEGIDALSSIGKMNLSVLEYLRERRMGFIYFKLGEYQKAKVHFWRSLNEITNEAYFIEMDEWLKRCDWMEENAEKPNL